MRTGNRDGFQAHHLVTQEATLSPGRVQRPSALSHGGRCGLTKGEAPGGEMDIFITFEYLKVWHIHTHCTNVKFLVLILNMVI